jgi:hypothetical protein
MKLLNRVTLVSVLGVAAVIGTGYAAWTFSSNTTADANANVLITTASTAAGTISFDKTVKLVLDQNWIGWVDAGAAPKDVYTNEDALASIIPTLAPHASSETAVSEFTLTCSVNYDVFANYLNFGAFASTWESGSAVVLPTVSWKDGMKPTTLTEYNTMKTALQGKTIVFTFNANVA